MIPTCYLSRYGPKRGSKRASNNTDPAPMEDAALDLYKQKERAIRGYFKTLAARTSKKNGRKWNPSKDQPYDPSELVDVRRSACPGRQRIFSNSSAEPLQPQYEMFVVQGLPEGFYIIPNALSEASQLHWARRAVCDYSTAEHTNLTNLEKLKTAEHIDPPSHVPSSSSALSLWETAVQEKNDYQSFFKLRWSSLGYHYDWTERKYEKNDLSEFPSDLRDLCRSIANAVGCTVHTLYTLYTLYL